MKQETIRYGYPSPTMVRSQLYLQEEQDVIYQAKAQNVWIYRVRDFDAYPHLKHAIFTRRGGVSLSPFDSLNLSVSVGDNPQTVQKNFNAACQAAGVDPEQTVSSHLIHGADVATIDQTNRQKVIGQADALITAEPAIYLFMRFGDCTPLLFFDPVRRAVGLSHAGWRGTMQNVAGATVAAMINQLGCQAENIIAVVGPAIGPCCYEVGPDVLAAADQAFDAPEQFFTQQSNRAGHAHFNLGAANQQQLLEAGVTHIIQSNMCTACRTDDFFSHRAENGQTGRFGVIIGIEDQ